MVMSTHQGGVDRDHPLGNLAVAATLQTSQDLLPGAVGRPGAMAAIDGAPRPILTGQIPPRRPGPGPPQDRVDHLPMRRPRPTPHALTLRWHKRLQPRPLVIGHVMASLHTT